MNQVYQLPYAHSIRIKLYAIHHSDDNLKPKEIHIIHIACLFGVWIFFFLCYFLLLLILHVPLFNEKKIAPNLYRLLKRTKIMNGTRRHWQTSPNAKSANSTIILKQIHASHGYIKWFMKGRMMHIAFVLF